MTLSKQFRDVFMPRMRDLIQNETKRMAQKGGVVKINHGWKLCDDLANDRVSQWMKATMEGSSAAQSWKAVPQVAAHKSAPKTKQALKGLGASRFASPSPAAAAIPKKFTPSRSSDINSSHLPSSIHAQRANAGSSDNSSCCGGELPAG
ncbi:hypothetical protein FALCPG4_018427 [Fusarium falciforme]